MFPIKNSKIAEEEDLLFGKPELNLAREEFFDSTDKKIFNTNVNREYLKNKHLLDINLQDRRRKLRDLLENEENSFTEEHLSKMDSLETRIAHLKEQALVIRKQTELERQTLANKKKYDQIRLNDDGIRTQQRIFHTEAIVEDWEKLKEIKKQINREEECIEKFWTEKKYEQIDEMIKKESVKQNKKMDLANEFLNYFAQKEKDKEIINRQEAENREKLKNSTIEVQRQLAELAVKQHQDKIAKQVRFKESLNDQIKYKQRVQDKHLSNEKAFDNAMNNENILKVRETEAKHKANVANNLKSENNFTEYQNCLIKHRENENQKINAEVNRIQNEKDKEKIKIEKERIKKYQKIAADMKNNLLEAINAKEVLKKEMEKGKDKFNYMLEESYKKDQMKIQKEKEECLNHYNHLKQQIEFNSYMKNLRKVENERERKSMNEAEQNYIKLINDIRSKDKLLFQHPWRAA